MNRDDLPGIRIPDGGNKQLRNGDAVRDVEGPIAPGIFWQGVLVSGPTLGSIAGGGIDGKPSEVTDVAIFVVDSGRPFASQVQLSPGCPAWEQNQQWQDKPETFQFPTRVLSHLPTSSRIGGGVEASHGESGGMLHLGGPCVNARCAMDSESAENPAKGAASLPLKPNQ